MPIEQPQQGLAVVSRELLQLIKEPPLADGRQPQLAPPGRHQGHLMALRIDPHCASQELGSLAASSSRRHGMPACDATKLGR